MSDHAEICALRHLGFTEYEARAYASLLRAGPQSCYGVAKQSGIPRANSYAVVDRLLERGALTKIKAPRGARYQAVPVPDLMSRIAAEHEAHRRAAESLLLSLGGPPTTPPAWQLEGNDEVLAAIRSVLLGASEQLVVALWPTEAGQLAPALFAAQTRGVEITTLCMAACDTECGGCVGRLYRCRAGALRDRRSLIVVADNREAVIADFHQATVSAVRTQRPLVSALASSYILQSILLGSFLTDTTPTVLDQLASVKSEDVLLDRLRFDART